MLVRAATAITFGATMLLAAAPAASQERGTIEFGAFGNASAFDSGIDVGNGWGGGGRLGAFLMPRLSVEFDVGYKRADRPNGLETAEVEAFAGRLTAVPLMFGPLSLLVGAGVIHTDYQLDETEGLQALLGAKLALGSSVALRVDGLADFNSNDTRNQAIQVGLSFYRRPAVLTRTVNVMTPAAPVAAVTQQAQRPDSVSASETRRLRALEAQHRALRDSLAAAGRMTDVVHFSHDESDLSAAARAILDQKVTLFRDNPAMRIVVTGFASEPGTVPYNMALGMRRAEATRAYLVTRGVDASRIEIASNGKGGLIVEGPGERAAAANRRAEFRLLVAGNI